MNRVLQFLVSYRYLFLILGAVVGAFFLGYFLHGSSLSRGEDCVSKYRFINPQPVCDLSEEENLAQFKILESAIVDVITTAEKEKGVTEVSVFIRDLLSNRWFSINDSKNYAPGSLMKLPLAMAYYKLAEVNPEVILRRVTYETALPVKGLSEVGSTSNLINGHIYTVDQIIDQMIINSDNNAMLFLFKNIDNGFLTKVFAELGVVASPTDTGGQEFISTRSYAGLLRNLYNASYLNREMSDHLLKHLSESTYRSGLVAGVPAQTLVAHKFGDRTVVNESDGAVLWRSLHDCGIVYKKDRNYIICVMTKGSDNADLSGVIKDISKITHEVLN